MFFSNGFRPFFLGAALFAGFAVPAWMLMLAGGGSSTALSVARDWHVHEMVFGFLPAVITGFLLTAVPNWTDRPPMQGRALMLLFALWLSGRLVMAVPLLAPVLSALIDGSFFVVVAGLVWRELAAGGSWNQAPVAGVISLYACANILFHIRAVSGEDIDFAVRVALALIMVLLTLIGGRLVPNFTREYLAAQQATRQPAAFSRFDGLCIFLVAMAVVAWVVRPQSIATGWLLVTAGFATVAPLSRWYGWLTWREPLVFILHWGYSWLALAMLLLGGAILGHRSHERGCRPCPDDRRDRCDDAGGDDAGKFRSHRTPSACRTCHGVHLPLGDGCRVGTSVWPEHRPSNESTCWRPLR